MYYDLVGRNWQTTFANHSSNSKKIVVFQAALGLGMIAVEHLC